MLDGSILCTASGQDDGGDSVMGIDLEKTECTRVVNMEQMHPSRGGFSRTDEEVDAISEAAFVAALGPCEFG